MPATLSIIKKFVEVYLEDTKGVQNIFEVGKNMMTYEILRVIKFMLHHGFYLDLREIKQIALPMINLLNGANDIYNKDSEEKEDMLEFNTVQRYFSSGNNDIIVQSKAIICENLLIIQQLEVDGKAQVFLSKFKNDLDMEILQKQMNLDQIVALVEQEEFEENPQRGCFGSKMV